MYSTAAFAEPLHREISFGGYAWKSDAGNGYCKESIFTKKELQSVENVIL